LSLSLSFFKKAQAQSTRPELLKSLALKVEPELFLKKLRLSSKPLGFSTHLPNMVDILTPKITKVSILIYQL